MIALKLILTLYPLVTEVIKTIEAAHPQSGVGQSKLELLKSLFRIAAQASPALTNGLPVDQFLGVIEGLAANIVHLFNITKVFRHAGAPDTPASPAVVVDQPTTIIPAA